MQAADLTIFLRSFWFIDQRVLPGTNSTFGAITKEEYFEHRQSFRCLGRNNQPVTTPNGAKTQRWVDVREIEFKKKQILSEG